jgi:hypothetical protein
MEKDEKDLEAGYRLSHFWQGFGDSPHRIQVRLCRWAFSTTPSSFSDDFPENQAMDIRTSLTKYPKD